MQCRNKVEGSNEPMSSSLKVFHSAKAEIRLDCKFQWCVMVCILFVLHNIERYLWKPTNSSVFALECKHFGYGLWQSK